MKAKLVSSLLALVVASAVILTTGCRTTDPVTGKDKFDEAKTALLLAPMKPTIGIAVKLAAEADINTGTGLRIVEQVIDAALDQEGTIERDTIQARVAEIQIPGLDVADNALVVTAIADMVLDYYDILNTYVIRQGLSSDNPADAAKIARMVLTTIQKGINLGLTLADLPSE